MANDGYVDTILDELGELKPTKLIHISDTHFPIKLRVSGRLDEYQEVIKNTLEEIKRISKENTTICVITGDIMHDKDRLDPDGVLMARRFMISLGKICSRVIVIAGNHDMNEANPKHSADALEPICFGTLNIKYLKNSGLYRLETREYEIVFVVSSLLDKKFITYEDARKSSNKRINEMKEVRYIKVYHGAICGASTGKYVIEKKSSSCSTRFRSLDEFEGYDLVLLGDIHKHQFLDKNKTIAYAGSLIQQNFGETINNHGILVWSFESSQIVAKFIQIYNPYCYIKLDVDKKGEINEPSKALLRDNQNKKLRLRIRTTKKMSQAERDNLKESLHIYDIKSITYQHQPEVLQRNYDQSSMPTPVFDSLNEEIKLMRKNYYQQKSSERKILEKMIELHRELHLKYKKERGLISSWCLKKLKFKNILIYGNNIENIVDFDSGVYSVSAPNTAGKSSLIEIILLGLFNGGITKKSNVISFGQSEGYIRTEFTANCASYEVILTLAKIRSEVTKECKLYEKNGTNEKNLTSTSITATYEKIKSIIGDCNYFCQHNVLSTRYQPHLLNIANAECLERLNKVFNMSKYEQYLNDGKVKGRKKRLDGDLQSVRAKIRNYNDEIKSINKEQNETIYHIAVQRKENLERDIKQKKTEIEKVHTKIQEICLKIGAANESRSHDRSLNLTKEQVESRMGELRSKYYDTIREYDEESLEQEIRKIKSLIPCFYIPRQKPVKTVIRDLKQQLSRLGEKIRSNSEKEPFFQIESVPRVNSVTQDLNALTLDELEKENIKLTINFENISKQALKLYEACEEVSKWAGIDENTYKKYNISETLPPYSKIKNILQIICKEKYTMIPEKTKSIYELLTWLKLQQPPVNIGREKLAEIINTLEHHEAYQEKLKLQEKIKLVDEYREEICNNVTKQNEIRNKMEFFALKKEWLEEKSKLENENAEIESALSRLKKLEKFDEMKEYYECAKKMNHLLYREEHDQLNKQGEKLDRELRNLENEKTDYIIKGNKALEVLRKHSEYISKISKCREKEESTQSELNVCENYMKLFHRDKIPLTMLSRMLSVFTTTVNEVFKNHTKYIFSHEFSSKTKKLEFSVTDKITNNRIPTNLLSGFESIIVKMAINKACSEISSHSHSRLLCVDEVLDCLDNQKFDTDLPKIIDAMTQEYQVVLIISHRDLPRGIVSNNIKIIKRDKYSEIDSETI